MNKKILVVDDDQLILYGLRKALQNNVYQVDTAATFDDAITHFSSCPYDLCLLDIHLPDGDGLQLMKIIKDICPESKIIVMTASYISDDELSDNIKQALENGACYFIPKPFDLANLKEIVLQALRQGEDFHPGYRFTGSGFVKKNRKFQRRPHGEKIRFSMAVIDQGATHRKYFGGVMVDICEAGICLQTDCPLQISQVISFDEELTGKSGVVIWSTMVDDQTCRAGIRFA